MLIFTERAWSAVSGTEMHPAVREARRLPTGEALRAPLHLFLCAPPFLSATPQKVCKESLLLNRCCLFKILLLSLWGLSSSLLHSQRAP